MATVKRAELDRFVYCRTLGLGFDLARGAPNLELFVIGAEKRVEGKPRIASKVPDFRS